MVVGASESVKPRYRRVIILFFAAFILLNAMAYRHARAFFFYTDGEARTPAPEHLGWRQKLDVLIRGIHVPKPKAHSTPVEHQMDYESIQVPGRSAETLAAWRIPREGADAMAILFHGYNSEKSGLLPEAKLLYGLGLEIVMVDFHGHGDSPGQQTTLGIREADDVAAVLAWARSVWPDRKIYLYGHSMGGAAVLRAVGVLNATPDGAIVESIFDTLLNAIRFRFHLLSVPAFPSAEILLFWGSQQLGVNGFRHDLRAYARHARVPVLVSHGTNDRRAALAGARDVHDGLAGPKSFISMEGAGHVNPALINPAFWSERVRLFLTGISTGNVAP